MVASNAPSDVFHYVDMRGGDECWGWLGGWGGRSRDRRPYFSTQGRRTMAYRIVFELVNGVELTRDQLLLHSCDRGSFPVGCCNPAHLRIGTVQENSDDMSLRERHGLPATVVQHIMKLLDEGRTQQEIGDLYGVSRETVSAIATGRVYKRHQSTE